MAAKIELGSKVKHKITGYTGIALGRATYLTGCDQILVKSQELLEGKIPDGYWIDDMMLDVLEAPTASTLPNKAETGNGGPQSDAPKGR